MGWAALTYGAALTAFIILPALFPSVYGPYRFLRWGDIIDLFTPLVVLPLAWWLFRVAAHERPHGWETVLFVAFAGLWASGQGMHLAANAIGHSVDVLASFRDYASGIFGMALNDVETLTHDLDEVVSHYIWHIGVLGLAAITMLRALRATGRFGIERWSWGVLGIGAGLYGFTFFISIIEAATTPMTVPGALVLFVGGVGVARTRIGSRPVLAFFLVAFALALILCFAWAAMNGWRLPEFSEVGLIK